MQVLLIPFGRKVSERSSLLEAPRGRIEEVKAKGGIPTNVVRGTSYSLERPAIRGGFDPITAETTMYSFLNHKYTTEDTKM